MPDQAVVESLHSNQNGHKIDNPLTCIRKDQHAKFNSVINLDTPEQPKYQFEPQEFECPRCGQEKIVGVNGSRRWRLNCMAEWPTADVFLAEVNAGGGQDFKQLSRQQLQSHFQNILAQLDEPDLARIETWLNTCCGPH